MDLLANDVVRLILLGWAIALLVGLVLVVRANRRRPGRVIRVVGVGGGGANAVDAMIRAGMRGVEYVAVNTDLRALNRSSAGTKIPVGRSITHGLGAGGDVSTGESAARDAAEEIGRAIAGSDLVVVTAGLGGGTGSGAAPIVAEIARQQGALTVAVVTKPFEFEGARRRQVAQDASAALMGLVDAVATVPNDRVREVMTADVTVDDAFRAIDETLHRSVSEIVDLVAVPGRVNLDFADVRAVLRGGGAAAVGFGRAAGENRATEAARNAMAATLLEDRIQGARSILVNVSGSRKLKLAELDAVAQTVLAATGGDANLVFGVSLQPRLRDEVQVTLIATGFGAARAVATQPEVAAVASPQRAVVAPPKAVAAPQQAVAAPQTAVPSPQRSVAELMETVAKPSEAVAEPPDAGAVTSELSADATRPEEWRPVWLRRSAPAGTPAPKSTPAPQSRRERRAAERGRRHGQQATDEAATD
ncbi:MAG: cell division protein FtsZ [Candidatus Limnocylindria bacterium]